MRPDRLIVCLLLIVVCRILPGTAIPTPPPDGAKWSKWVIKPNEVFTKPKSYETYENIDLTSDFYQGKAVTIKTHKVKKGTSNNLFYQVCYLSLQDPYKYSDCFNIKLQETDNFDEVKMETFADEEKYSVYNYIPQFKTERDMWSRIILYIFIYRTTDGKEYDGANLDNTYHIKTRLDGIGNLYPSVLYKSTPNVHSSEPKIYRAFTPGLFTYEVDTQKNLMCTKEYLKLSLDTHSYYPTPEMLVTLTYRASELDSVQVLTWLFKNVKRDTVQISEPLGPFFLKSLPSEAKTVTAKFTYRASPVWNNPVGTSAYSATDFPMGIINEGNYGSVYDARWKQGKIPDTVPATSVHIVPSEQAVNPEWYISGYKVPTPESKSWKDYSLIDTVTLNQYDFPANPEWTGKYKFKVKEVSDPWYEFTDAQNNVLWTEKVPFPQEEKISESMGLNEGNQYNTQIYETPQYVNEHGTFLMKDTSINRYILIDKNGKETPLPASSGSLESRGYVYGKYWCLVGNCWKSEIFPNSRGMLLIDDKGVIYKKCEFPEYTQVNNLRLSPDCSRVFFEYEKPTPQDKIRSIGHYYKGIAFLRLDGTVIKDFVMPAFNLNNLVFSPSGDIAVIPGEQDTYLIDTQTGNNICILKRKTMCAGVSDYTAGLVMVVVDKKVLVLNYLTRELVSLVLLPETPYMPIGSMNADGKEFKLIYDVQKHIYRQNSIK